MVAQDQQHTAAWLAAANPPPRHAREDRDQRENQKETDREDVCERTLSEVKGEGGRQTGRRMYMRKEEVAKQHREKQADLKDTGKMMHAGNVFMCERQIQPIYMPTSKIEIHPVQNTRSILFLFPTFANIDRFR